MQRVNNTPLLVGDWVSGTSIDDERIRGYVETVRRDYGSVLVRVTESDHEASIGKLVESAVSKLEKLSDVIELDEKNLVDLIDLSLAVRDEAWFLELTSSLQAISTPGNKLSAKVLFYQAPRHKRIWID